MRLRALILLLPSLCFLGCGSLKEDYLPFLYRIDIQQGNIIEQEMLIQLTSGLSRDEVRDIMGTPSLKTPFDHQRWHYIYNLKEPSKTIKQRSVILHFEEDKLAYISGDVIPATKQYASPIEEQPNIWTVPDQPSEGLFKGLWKR